MENIEKTQQLDSSLEKVDGTEKRKYDTVWDFQPNGLAKVMLNRKYGLINKQGEEILECKYDFIKDFQPNGLVVVELNEKSGLVNEKGEIVVECKFDDNEIVVGGRTWKLQGALSSSYFREVKNAPVESKRKIKFWGRFFDSDE